MKTELVYPHDSDIYSLEGFEPAIVDKDYLDSLGVNVEPAPETLAALKRGSEIFKLRMATRKLSPAASFDVEDCDPDKVEPEIHNYTGRCPTLTLEINPVRGCNVGCQYCLVTDGVHEQRIVAYENYHLYVRKLLEEMNGTPTAPATKEDIIARNRLLQELADVISDPSKAHMKKDVERRIVELSRGKNWNHYYYFSPKTEALQEPTLQTGIAHRILREFIAHFEKYPQSNARLFVASKAGLKHLLVEDEGETIADLFEKLKDRMQFNTSVSMMPDGFRTLIEPGAAPISERLAAVRYCASRGIMANSALVQPILTPCLTDKYITEFFTMLRDSGIINYKPEFLTACPENLAMLGQWLGHWDKAMEKKLYEDYLMPSNADHRKQRGRTAPDRALSLGNIQRLKKCTDALGMTVSICFWVRNQLDISPSLIPIVNANGFQCLGYQSRLFSRRDND